MPEKHILEILSHTAQLEPGCQPVVEQLARHLPLYVISNGLQALQAKRIASTPISPFFRDIIVSGDLGIAKPDRGIFDALINRHDLTRSRMIYIGDSLRDDYTGCQNSGIDFCFYNRKSINTPDHSPHYEIQRLEQLLGLLGLD